MGPPHEQNAPPPHTRSLLASCYPRRGRTRLLSGLSMLRFKVLFAFSMLRLFRVLHLPSYRLASLNPELC